MSTLAGACGVRLDALGVMKFVGEVMARTELVHAARGRMDEANNERSIFLSLIRKEKTSFGSGTLLSWRW